MGNGSFDGPMSPDEVGEDDFEEKEAIVPPNNTGAEAQMSAGSVTVTPTNQTMHHNHGHPQWPLTSSPPMRSATGQVTFLDGNNMPVSQMTSDGVNGSVMTPAGEPTSTDVSQIKMELPNLNEIHNGHPGGINTLPPHMTSMGHQLGSGVNDWFARKANVPVHVLSQLHAINQQ